ncbi:MAG TPA: hypothetical protein VH500_01900 [Nitrososphaeraceae archaeon]|jgi:hypothetical protein
MTNRTTNKALLLFGLLATILVTTGILSALIAQPAAAEKTSSVIKNTQTHSCHFKAKNSPILNSCNDVAKGSVSYPGESKESTK